MKCMLFFALLFSMQAQATDDIGTERKLGLGLGGGSLANGITGKLYLSPNTAVQGVLGQFGNYGTNSGISMSADFIQEIGSLAEVDDVGRLFWGVGAGAGLVLSGDVTSIGVSGVVEIGWHFERFPLEVTTDWRPTMYLSDGPLTGLYFRYGGGAIRYFF